MRYQVVEDRHLQEFDIWLDPGVEFEDGDLEPDVVANLLNYGAVVPLGTAAKKSYAVGVDYADSDDFSAARAAKYNSVTRHELDGLAEDRGIDIKSDWNKPDVIAALEAYDTEGS